MHLSFSNIVQIIDDPNIDPVYSEEAYRCFKFQNNTAEEQREPSRKNLYGNRSSVCLPYVPKFAKRLTLTMQWCSLKLYIYLPIHMEHIFIYKVESIASQDNTLTVKSEHTK